MICSGWLEEVGGGGDVVGRLAGGPPWLMFGMRSGLTGAAPESLGLVVALCMCVLGRLEMKQMTATAPLPPVRPVEYNPLQRGAGGTTWWRLITQETDEETGGREFTSRSRWWSPSLTCRPTLGHLRLHSWSPSAGGLRRQVRVQVNLIPH